MRLAVWAMELGATRTTYRTAPARDEVRVVVRIRAALLGGTSPRPVHRPGTRPRGSSGHGTFAIAPVNQRFLIVRDHSWGDMAGTPTLVLVQNLVDELRAKLKQ